MKECKFCKIKVNTDKERCPVCKSALEGETPPEYVPEFPTLKSGNKDKILKRIFNIIFVAIAVFFGVSLILTVILPDYDPWWSFFLALTVVSAFAVVRISIFTNTGLPRRIFFASFVCLVTVILIDALFFHIFHFKGEIIMEWSLIFVLPSVTAAVLIVFTILMMANRKNMSDYYVYVFFEMLINIAPLLIYNIWGIGYNFVAYGCVILDILIAGILCAVNFRSIVEEIKKKLHI